MPPAEPVWIALGSNLGARARYLSLGRAGLAALPGTRAVAASRIEETAALGPPGQGPYLNQMVLVMTSLAPRRLLAALQALERRAGRRRHQRWGARTLDLDIVRFGDRALSEPGLTVPHPELPRRPFWHRELEELAPHVR